MNNENGKFSIKLLSDGTRIPTQTKEFVSCNLLEATAGTNGPCGGDAGHECRTYIRIQNQGGTAMNVRIIMDEDERPVGVEMVFGGDSELGTAARAFDFIQKVLHNQMDRRGYYCPSVSCEDPASTAEEDPDRPPNFEEFLDRGSRALANMSKMIRDKGLSSEARRIYRQLNYLVFADTGLEDLFHTAWGMYEDYLNAPDDDDLDLL